MKVFADIFHTSLNKAGEELCGDQVRVLKTSGKTYLVLSDGLGSGVKANILASLGSEIIVTMLREEVSLEDVVETILGTLPICKVRKIAYAAFSILEINHITSRFKFINFDNPSLFFFKNGKVNKLAENEVVILDKKLRISEGEFSEGDFLMMISDGVLYAGLGQIYNFGWGWDNIADFIGKVLLHGLNTAKNVIQKTMLQTSQLYGGVPGDDATMVGIYLRPRHSAMVFTGPPMDEEDDEYYAEKLLSFNGRRIICGGTTGNIVAGYLNKEIETDITSMHNGIPPIGFLEGVDLLTEGVLTLIKTLELIENGQGRLSLSDQNKNGAFMLVNELLAADDITFQVGLQINPFYQNPILPMSVSIRKNLIERLAEELRKLNKDISVQYC